MWVNACEYGASVSKHVWMYLHIIMQKFTKENEIKEVWKNIVKTNEAVMVNDSCDVKKKNTKE